MSFEYKDLVSSDPLTRTTQAKRVAEHLKTSLDALALSKLGNALFYCFWMTDKPENQTEMAINIAQFVIQSLPLFQCLIQRLADEWTNLDVLRLNKFYHLIDTILPAAFTHDTGVEVVLQVIRACKRVGVRSYIVSHFLPNLCTPSSTQALPMFRQTLESLVANAVTNEEMMIDSVKTIYNSLITNESISKYITQTELIETIYTLVNKTAINLKTRTNLIAYFETFQKLGGFKLEFEKTVTRATKKEIVRVMAPVHQQKESIVSKVSNRDICDANNEPLLTKKAVSTVAVDENNSALASLELNAADLIVEEAVAADTAIEVSTPISSKTNKKRKAKKDKLPGPVIEQGSTIRSETKDLGILENSEMKPSKKQKPCNEGLALSEEHVSISESLLPVSGLDVMPNNNLLEQIVQTPSVVKSGKKQKKRKAKTTKPSVDGNPAQKDGFALGGWTTNSGLGTPPNEEMQIDFVSTETRSVTFDGKMKVRHFMRKKILCESPLMPIPTMINPPKSALKQRKVNIN